MQRRLNFLDISIWVLAVYLMLHLPSIETRVDEMEQAAQKYREQSPSSTESPPSTTTVPSTPPPRRVLEPNKCFNMPRSECPQGVLKCRQVDIESVFCCDVNNFTLKEGLAATMSQQNMSHVKYLHVLNASLSELNISLSHYRRLSSMAFTDGNIGNITGQFPKHAVLSCLNISNNNLSMDLPSVQRPFAYLFNLSVLDASHNNLTEFPLITHSNRKVAVDLSGNKYMPCRHFQRAMESNNTIFMNINNTFCALDLKVSVSKVDSFINDLTFVPINYITWQKMINESCRNIKPNVNCSCAPERFDLVGDDVTRVVAVDCTNRHLKEMPVNLPPNTVKLNVSFNNITSLKAVEDDPTYDHVRQLIVDNNEISSLTDLEGTKFLDNFIYFSMTHNKLKTIPIHVFTRRFTSPAPSVLIGQNYIHCDCNTEKNIKPFLVENHKNIPDYKLLQCDNNMGPVVDLLEFQVCHTSRDWTDYIYYIITLEVLVLMLLISKVSYDYWVFKTTGYLPWPANKMPRLPCDWFCE